MSEAGDGYHAGDGWHFKRQGDGSVRVRAPDSAGPGASQTIGLSAPVWASAVASVCARGETAETFAEALAAHQRDWTDGELLERFGPALRDLAERMLPPPLAERVLEALDAV